MPDLIELLEESIQGRSYSEEDFRNAADFILKVKEQQEKGTPEYMALSVAFAWCNLKRKELFLKRLGIG